ncbi:MAG: EVE domain-containing protein [Alkalilacustris sp.]
MAFWLMKSEPDVFSWDDLVARGARGEAWDGVRNYQARNHMRAMTMGDRAFFYHSRKAPAVVGICEICALAHPDPTTDDPRWECVDVRALTPLPRPVPLAEIRAEPRLADMVLVRNARLSVQPVTPAEWDVVCAMGGLDTP